MRLDTRVKSLFLLALFCVASLSMASFAVRADADPNGTYALSPDGSGMVWREPYVEPVEMPPPYVPAKTETSDTPDTETEDSGNPDLTELLTGIGGFLGAFTPDGNLSLIDDFLYSGLNANGDKVEKQFLTVQSKAGNYYYIVIDRAGDTENVYFLNLVDEADLMALMEDEKEEEPEPPPVCSCKDKCYVGHVDTACPICAVNMAACAGKAPEPTPTPTPTPEPTEEPQKDTGGKAAVIGAVFVVILILALAGGAVFYVMKVRGSKATPQTSGDTDLDDYDYGADEDEDDAELLSDMEADEFAPYYPEQKYPEEDSTDT